jgi:hypothetical protein
MQTAQPIDDQSLLATAREQPLRTRPIVRPGPSPNHRVLQRAGADASRGRGADYVTIPVAAAMTGYSAKAIRRKIESGVWLEGREFRRAPDGHVLISVKGYESWVERGRA